MAHFRRKFPTSKDAVLLVIDMQEYFRGIASQILPAMRRTIDAARAAGVPVIYTRHSHRGPADYGMLAEWWGSLIMEGTPDAELLPEVGRRATDKLVHKNTCNCFYNTDLEAHLRYCGRKEVIITGVMTNLCCETTARDAFVRGFRVFFSTDATATFNQDFHNATLKNMGYGFAYLVDAKSIEDCFRLRG